jgi:3-methylcrotonyl-CoA carboxylase beta subunit
MSSRNIARACRRAVETTRRSYHFDALASKLPNTVNKGSEDFIDNAQKMDALCKDLKDLFKTIEQGGPPKAREKHLAAGKMLPRQRLDRLLDPDSPFLELSQYAGHELYDGQSLPAAGLITGIGQVSGVKCMIIVNDPTVKGGAYGPIVSRAPLLRMS